MPVFHLRSSFQPLRLTAFIRNDVEMRLEIENLSEELLWVETEVGVPDSVSLAPNRDLEKARLRVGIIPPKTRREVMARIYASGKSYPDSYKIAVALFGFGRDGALYAREDKQVELRCERVGSA